MTCLKSLLPEVSLRARVRLLAAFNAISYISFSIPAVIAGIVATKWGVGVSTYGYGLALIALTLLGYLVHPTRNAHRTKGQHAFDRRTS